MNTGDESVLAEPDPLHPSSLILHPSESLVIFIDEIDAVLSLPFSTDEFFAAIRECYNRRSSDPRFCRLTFCLLGVATPSDLIRDVRTTPFNIGRRIELTDFTPAEAKPLARGLWGRNRSGSASAARPKETERQANRLLERVLYWTGGHPYLTQRLCHVLALALNGTSGEGDPLPAVRCVDTHCRELFLSDQGAERDNNLLFVRDRLLRTGADLAALLDFLGRIAGGRAVPADETHPLLDLLRLSGIVGVGRDPRTGRRTPTIRNRIYAYVFGRSWIRSRMPDAELRRQRTAYRRGVARASALAAGIGSVMLALTLMAIGQAGVARKAQANSNSLNRSLRASLNKQFELNRQLAVALDGARRAQTRATRAARQALAAGRREFEQRKKAQAAGQAAAQARREALNRLSRACIDVSTRAAGTGDLLGALPPLAEALKLDEGNSERALIHRIRLATLLRAAPGLREMWNAGSDVRSLAVNAGHSRAAAGCDGGEVRLFDLRGPGNSRTLLRGAGSVVELAFSPNGRRLATVDQVGSARVWDASTGRPLSPALPGLGHLKHLAWHPNGRRIAIGGDNGVVVWEIAPVRRVCEVRFTGAEGCRPVFSPDGRRLAVVSGNFLGWMADAETGKPQYHLARCFNGGAVRFSPDGKQLLVGGGFGNPVTHRGAVILEVVSGTPLHSLAMPQHGNALAYSRDGRRVVVGDRDGNVQVWDPLTGKPTAPPFRLSQEVTAVSFSPEGKTVAAASLDGTVEVRDTEGGQALCAPLRHGRWVTGVVFGPNDRCLVSTSRDGAARRWNLPPRRPSVASTGDGMPGADEEVVRLEHLAGDRWAVGLLRRRTGTPLGGQEEVRVWNSRTGGRVARGAWRRFAISEDRRWLALAGEDGVQLWDVVAGRTRGPLCPVDLSRAELFLQPGGRWLAALQPVSEGNSRLQMTDLFSGRTQAPQREPVRGVYGFFDAGRVLWYVDPRNHVRLWPVPAGSPASGAKSLPPAVVGPHVTASADGRTVITVYGASQFRVWNGRGEPLTGEQKMEGTHPWAHGAGATVGGKGRLVMFGYGHGVQRDYGIGFLINADRHSVGRLPGGEALPQYNTAVFSPAGDRFAAFTSDGEIRIWDARTARPVSAPMHHGTVIPALAFSPDGRKLVTGTLDGTARVWDAFTGRPLTPFLTHPATVQFAAFSPDGRLVLTRAEDGKARVWDALTGEGVVLPLDVGLRVDNCRFLPDSRRVLAQCGPRVLVYNLQPDPRPVPELARLCLVLAAHRADRNGGLQALEPDELRTLWQTASN